MQCTVLRLYVLPGYGRPSENTLVVSDVITGYGMTEGMRGIHADCP